MANPIELIVFDCAGVLVDSERLGVQAESEMINAEGWHLTPMQVAERFLGRTDVAMRDDIEHHTGRALGDEWLRRLHDNYVERFNDELAAVPGIVNLLDALDEFDVETCVASSGSPDKIVERLGMTGLLDRFEGRLFSALSVARGKPAPDLFLYAAKLMNGDPSRCIVIEDSPFGVAAARSAGMEVIGYSTELLPSGFLDEGSTAVVTDMAQVLPLLRQRLRPRVS